MPNGHVNMPKNSSVENVSTASILHTPVLHKKVISPKCSLNRASTANTLRIDTAIIFGAECTHGHGRVSRGRLYTCKQHCGRDFTRPAQH